MTVRVGSEDDLQALIEVAAADGVTVESWDTVTPLCPACSAGRVDQDQPHDHDISDGPLVGGRASVGMAASLDVTNDLLARWVDVDPPSRGAGTPEAVA